MSTGWITKTTPVLKNGEISYDTQVSMKEAVPTSAFATGKQHVPIRVNAEFLTRDFYATGSAANGSTVWLKFKTNSDNKVHLVFLTFIENEKHVASSC